MAGQANPGRSDADGHQAHDGQGQKGKAGSDLIAIHWPAVEFEKWQALGNDYVILEAAALPFQLTPGAGPGHLRPAHRGLR